MATDSLGQEHTVTYALCRQERRDDVRLLEYFKDIMCGTYDTRTFVMDSTATEISLVQSRHSHADIILCSLHVLRALPRKVRANSISYLLQFRNPDVRKCSEPDDLTREPHFSLCIIFRFT